MSQEQLKTVFSTVQDNSTIQEQLNRAANVETVFKFAKKAGLNVPIAACNALQLRGDDPETMSGEAMTSVQTLGC